MEHGESGKFTTVSLIMETTYTNVMLTASASTEDSQNGCRF